MCNVPESMLVPVPGLSTSLLLLMTHADHHAGGTGGLHHGDEEEFMIYNVTCLSQKTINHSPRTTGDFSDKLKHDHDNDEKYLHGSTSTLVVKTP